MTLCVGNYSANNTSSNYGLITRINGDDTIEVKLTIETTIRKFKKDNVNIIPLHSTTELFDRDQPEYFFLQSNQHQL